MKYGRIVGWGKYAPARVLTNADLANMVDTSDEWIVTRTGIRQRHIAGDGETTATMSVAASRGALSSYRPVTSRQACSRTCWVQMDRARRTCTSTWVRTR